MQLYFVEMVNDATNESFFKVGVTKHENVKERFAFGKTTILESKLPLQEILSKALAGEKYIPDHPYRVKLIHQVTYLLEGDALIAEKELLAALKPKQYWPRNRFNGSSECFKGEELQALIIAHMDEDSAHRNSVAPSELQYKLHAAYTKEADPIKKHLQVLQKCKR